MAMTEEEMNAIALKVYELSKKDNEPKISPDWRKLSKEIQEFIKVRVKKDGIGYMTIQDAIYRPIKYVLGLKDVRQITADQVPTARKIFEFIKQQREEVIK
ncbi:hypothetical protein LMB39_08560 [Limosilactobacillus reuteri]|nr:MULTISPECIES: hypothetical protein [Limosilactobacillus]MCC4347662.1 hypothetical protein [Limosilactobacillus reuteri]MCC4349332.1 hypothetical protein [Limosilactobacillus reuteri]MCC4359723.1 hypothetical protein [Limosilactobacillus reuteri]MCC4373842.1 hypothetical protein [Limosilactobacillus reuteri]MCC4379660.1 hypothetical protein [Limosilactobacillus reuteri]